MEMRLKKARSARISFPMIDSVSPENFKSGLSITLTAWYDDGSGWTSLTVSDTPAEIGSSGIYEVTLSSSELDHGSVMLKATASGAADQSIIIRTYFESDELAGGEVGVISVSSLQVIRAQFIELSGRMDLNRAPAAPLNSLYYKKADFYINGACKWLDDNVDIDRKTAKYSKDVSAGTYKILVPDAKVVYKVFAQYSDENIIELEEKPYSWLRQNYMKGLSQLTNSKPAYWCKGVPDLGTTQLDLQTTDYTGEYTYEFGDTMFADESTPGDVGRYRTMTLLIAPPVDQTFTITVIGEYYSKFLSSDSDYNLWTARYPELTLKATLRELEGFYRNTEGRKDWEDFLTTDKLGIEFNKADQESANIKEMEG